MTKPQPIDEEKIIESNQYSVSYTDEKGIIKGANAYFSELSGYSLSELRGSNHNIIRHPDMPKVVFKMMWERIAKRKNIILFIKNLAKDGRYYWIITDFEILMSKENPNQIESIYAYRKVAPKGGVEEISRLYKELLDLEKNSGMEASAKFLHQFLEKKRLSYDEYVEKLIGKKNQNSFLKSVKSLFNKVNKPIKI